MDQQLLKELEQHKLRLQVINHPFFATVKNNQLTTKNVAIFLEQYYYPIQYFTYYLSKLVSVLPTISMQTSVSKILWQELGEGNPKDAHLNLYFVTMEEAGFNLDAIKNSIPFFETEVLVEGYKKSTDNYLSGLGFLYATETIDLTIVSGLGRAVQKVSSRNQLPWIDIHLKQEPDHVKSSKEVLDVSFSAEERQQIIKSAEENWKLWNDFFTALNNSINIH